MNPKHPARGLLLVIVATAAAGCGKTSVNTQTASKQPTHAQTVKAADAACAQSARRVQPLVAQVAAIDRSHTGLRRRYTAIGPRLEEAAAGTRIDARTLQELPVAASERLAIHNFAYTLLELSVMEEQLAQAYRTVEPPRVRLRTPDVLSNRQRAHQEASHLGFKVCGLTPQVAVR